MSSVKLDPSKLASGSIALQADMTAMHWSLVSFGSLVVGKKVATLALRKRQELTVVAERRYQSRESKKFHRPMSIILLEVASKTNSEGVRTNIQGIGVKIKIPCQGSRPLCA
jgi:hypothetical protein